MGYDEQRKGKFGTGTGIGYTNILSLTDAGRVQ